MLKIDQSEKLASYEKIVENFVKEMGVLK